MDKEVIKKLFEQLWLQSNHASLPIENIWFSISETAKITGRKREEIKEIFDSLVSTAVFEKLSDEPLLFQFTEKGRKIKTHEDIKKYLA